MAQLFSNAFVERIEKATAESLPSPNHALISTICTEINQNVGKAKDAAKCIRKRLQHQSSQVVSLTLTMLDEMMRNCVADFHRRIGSDEFLKDFVLTAKKRMEPEIRSRMLGLLEAWGIVFKDRSDLPFFQLVHDQLKRSGVMFPPPDGLSYNRENYVHLQRKDATANLHHRDVRGALAPSAPTPDYPTIVPLQVQSSPQKPHRPTYNHPQKPNAPYVFEMPRATIGAPLVAKPVAGLKGNGRNGVGGVFANGAHRSRSPAASPSPAAPPSPLPAAPLHPTTHQQHQNHVQRQTHASGPALHPPGNLYGNVGPSPIDLGQHGIHHGNPAIPHQTHGQAPAIPFPAALTPEQVRDKLSVDVSTAHEIVDAFSDVVSFLDPKMEELGGGILLRELRQKCCEVQEKATSLCSVMDEEDLVSELSRVRSDCTRVLQLYDAMISGKKDMLELAAKPENQPQIPKDDHEFPADRFHAKAPRKAPPKPVATDEFDRFMDSRMKQLKKDPLASSSSSSSEQSKVSVTHKKEALSLKVSALAATAVDTQQSLKPANPIAPPRAVVFEGQRGPIVAVDTLVNPLAEADEIILEFERFITSKPESAPIAHTQQHPKKQDNLKEHNSELSQLQRRLHNLSTNPMTIGPDCAKQPPTKPRPDHDRDFEDLFGL